MGRSEHLQLFATALEAAAKGRGSVVDLIGEPGVGKTRLLREMLGNGSGFSSLLGRGDPRHGTRPFSALPDELAAVAGAARPVDRLEADMRASLTGPVSAGGYVAFDAVLEEVERRASVHPQVVAVDDAQWADRASALALQSLASGLGQEPVVLLIARRPGPCAWSQLADHSGFGSVSIDPLSPDEVAELAEATGESAAALPQADELAATEGNPFLLSRVLSTGRAGGDWGPSLAHLEPELVELLSFAAVLGPTFKAADLGALVGRSASTIAAPLREAVALGLLFDEGELRFAHELIREELLGRIPESARRALYGEAAVYFAATAASPSAVAYFAMEGEGRLPANAVTALRKVATELSVHDPARSAELMRTAMRELPAGTQEWVDATCELALILTMGGEHAQAEEAALGALTAAREVSQERALRLILGQIRYARGDIPGALRHLERIDQMDCGAESEAESTANSAVLRLLNFDLEGARTAAKRVVESDVRAAPEPRSIANMVMSNLEMVAGRTAQAVTYSLDAVRDADESVFGQAHALHPNLFAALALSLDDQHEETEAALRTSFDIGRQLGTGWEVPLWHGVVASEHFRAGRLDDCDAECATGLQLSKEHGLHLADVLLASHSALVALHKGDSGRAEMRLTEAEDALSHLGPRIGSVHFAWARGLWLRTNGRQPEGELLLQAAVNFAIPAGLLGRLAVIGPDVVRMAKERNDLLAAKEVVDGLATLAERSGAPSIRAAALRGRALVDDDGDDALEAVECFSSCNRPLEEAATRQDASRVLERTERHDEAAEQLSRAIELFDAAGAVASASLLREMGPGLHIARTEVAGWDALTKAERTVSLLVAKGLSNPSVGEHLFISRRTVETHLYRAYSKLQVSSRVELTLLVEREGRSETIV